MWGKYKACRENIIEHTGGGDGDEDWYGSSNDGESGPDGFRKDSQSRKRKRGHLRNDITGAYARSTLLEFMKGPFYDMVDRVYVLSFVN